MKQDQTASVLIITGILFLAFSALWMWLELLCYGEVQPRIVDDIIGFIMLYSFYLNVRGALNQSKKGRQHYDEKI